ncbi:hypothetical protein PR202_ga28130 [Eleusine coracana subsp. coracana]|uniref:Uncharacterized protein n=1 Tax=Eleusine coracana subsp. coracana TaxID=191504 RepID=A0AAV5DIB0_ELECO|nr:hypothetical protein PR202_ga28130 [Eleusine coracana subsp. coracana]
MYGLLTTPCPRAPLLGAVSSPSTRALPRTLGLPPNPLPRGLRARSRCARARPRRRRRRRSAGCFPPRSRRWRLACGASTSRAARAPVAPPAGGGAAVAGGVYREVLLVGVLLSWFPNIPWDRQPFSALRDLCDPFLALCREVMPPVFGRKLDLSPLVAFIRLAIHIDILRPQPRM